MKNNHVLHGLDAVMGGDPYVIYGMRDAKINMSLGAQGAKMAPELQKYLEFLQISGVDLTKIKARDVIKITGYKIIWNMKC